MQDIKESNYDLFDPANIFPELQAMPVPQATPVLIPPELSTPGLTAPEQTASVLIEPEPEALIEEEPIKELPTDSELYEIFDRLNFKYFDNQIPRLNIKYSKRMLIAGSYCPTKKEIKIGWKYHLIFRNDIEDTMAHEMIHYFYPNHGRQFRAMAKSLGVSLKAKEHPGLRLTCRYLYYCPNCGRECPRQKRLRMASCGKCSTGRQFDARFKLKLKKN